MITRALYETFRAIALLASVAGIVSGSVVLWAIKGMRPYQARRRKR